MNDFPYIEEIKCCESLIEWGKVFNLIEQEMFYSNVNKKLTTL